jgi:uncharacterized protein (TIGR03067 family)
MSVTQVVIILAAAVAAIAAAVYRERRGLSSKPKWTPSQAEAADFAAIQGEWSVISMRREGTLVEGPPCLYVFEGDAMFLRPEGKRSSAYSFQLDGSHHPKRLMIIASWTSGKVTASESGYEPTTEELRWCHIGGQCPKQLLPDDSPVGTVITLRRA